MAAAGAASVIVDRKGIVAFASPFFCNLVGVEGKRVAGVAN